MLRRDEVTLVRSAPSGVFSPGTKRSKTVLCNVRSVTMAEAYEAAARNLRPELVFVLGNADDYRGEQTVKFHGAEFDIIRTYQAGKQIELVAQRTVKVCSVSQTL